MWPSSATIGRSPVQPSEGVELEVQTTPDNEEIRVVIVVVEDNPATAAPNRGSGVRATRNVVAAEDVVVLVEVHIQTFKLQGQVVDERLLHASP